MNTGMNERNQRNPESGRQSATGNFLIFHLNGVGFAVATGAVKEIVPLATLTPVEGVLPFIIGMLNLRGKVVPVMDLNVRFGHHRKPLHSSNRIIFLENEDCVMGMVVTEVSDVLEINASDVQPVTSHMRNLETCGHLLTGEARLNERIIFILNLDNLIWNANFPEENFSDSSENHAAEEPGFLLDANEEERELLKQRSIALAQSLIDEDKTQLDAVGLIEYGNEIFGIDLKNVREFTEIKDLVPVPGTPPHILGNMNLRGEILTVVDIFGFLNISSPEHKGLDNAVVLKYEEFPLGIAVENFQGLVYLAPSKIKSSITETDLGSESLFKGTFAIQEKLISILDLEAILKQEGLAVPGDA